MDLLSIFRRSPKPTSHKMVGRRVRGFQAAKTDRLNSAWLTSSESINTNLKDGLGPLRARSRDQYLNNDFVRRFVSMAKINIVGSRGVTLQARTIGRGDKLDGPANQAIEAAFSDWGNRKNCDLTERCTWVELQQQALISAVVDGEILARHIPGRQMGGKYGYKIQMLDPDTLDASYNMDAPNGNRIRLGVEIDDYGRPAAYHLLDRSPTESYTGINGRSYVRVPASQIIHAFVSDHVGQLRGYPWVSTSLARLKALDAYFEAAVIAARFGASKMGIITTPDGSSYVGDDVDDNGTTLMEIEPGEVKQLAAGETWSSFDPAYPHEQFGTFVKTCLEAIAGSMGPGVSYSALSGDLEGVNYSSIRAGVLEEREAWKATQQWFIGAFCEPVYEQWLPMALLTARVVPGSDNRRPMPLTTDDLDKCRRVSWQARRWAWVDPRNDMEASITAINNKLTTRSAVIRESGRDPEDVFAELAMEQEMMAGFGLTEIQEAKVVDNADADVA